MTQNLSLGISNSVKIAVVMPAHNEEHKILGVLKKIPPEIVKNYLIFNALEQKFNRIDFKLSNGLLIDLDLSNVSSHISRSNILKSLPNYLGELTHLKKLDLKINRLSTLPESISSLSSLEFIDLSYNKIKYLPKSIGSLSSLKTLYLRYNDLKSLPNSISSLKNLRILDLRVNKLTNLNH